MQFPEIPNGGNGGGKNFLKLKDKESVTLALMGDPLVYFAKWNGSHYETCSPETPKAAMRFRFNVILKDKESGQLVSKIWEGPKKLFNQLKGLNDEYDLDTIFVKVTRYGAGTETEYAVLPAKEQRNEAVEKRLSAVPLQDLSIRQEENSLSPFDAEEAIPF